MCADGLKKFDVESYAKKVASQKPCFNLRHLKEHILEEVVNIDNSQVPFDALYYQNIHVSVTAWHDL